MLSQAAFHLETVAHLQGFERELLPLAEHLRKVERWLRQVEAMATASHNEDPRVSLVAIRNALK